jgi:hypothetical protein
MQRAQHCTAPAMLSGALSGMVAAFLPTVVAF